MKYKEKKCIDHLARTCILVSSLNNDDIKTMNNVKKKERNIEIQRDDIG